LADGPMEGLRTLAAAETVTFDLPGLPAIASVLRQALKPNPRERYASAEAFRVALHDATGWSQLTPEFLEAVARQDKWDFTPFHLSPAQFWRAIQSRCRIPPQVTIERVWEDLPRPLVAEWRKIVVELQLHKPFPPPTNLTADRWQHASTDAERRPGVDAPTRASTIERARALDRKPPAKAGVSTELLKLLNWRDSVSSEVILSREVPPRVRKAAVKVTCHCAGASLPTKTAQVEWNTVEADKSLPIVFALAEEVIVLGAVPPGAAELASLIPYGPDLRKLVLHDTRFEDEGGAAVLRACKNMPALQHLDMSSCRLSEEMHGALAVPFGTGLEHLDLSSNQLGPKAAQGLQHALISPGVKLKHLELADNAIADGVFHICRAVCKKTSKLQYLGLNANVVRGETMRNFGSEIGDLEVLVLSNNPIGGTGVNAVIDSGMLQEGLKHLDVSGCDLKMSELVKLGAICEAAGVRLRN